MLCFSTPSTFYVGMASFSEPKKWVLTTQNSGVFSAQSTVSWGAGGDQEEDLEDEVGRTVGSTVPHVPLPLSLRGYSVTRLTSGFSMNFGNLQHSLFLAMSLLASAGTPIMKGIKMGSVQGERRPAHLVGRPFSVPFP